MIEEGDESDAGGLARWLVPVHSPGHDLIAAFMGSPRFAKASRRMSEKMVAAAMSDPAFDGISKDIGRYVTTAIAIYLDATGGITLARLKEFCISMNIASPGRSRAILLYLRFLRYVVPAPGTGRATTYVATEQLRTTWRRLAEIALDAASIVEHGVESIRDNLSDPEYMRELLAVYCDGMLYSSSTVPRETAFWRVFLNRNAGVQLLHHLMLAADPDDDYPPRGPVRVSLTQLAKRLNVSRPHLTRMLKAAEAEHLIQRSGDAIVFSEQLRKDIAFVLAVRMTGVLFCAARVECDRADRRPWRMTLPAREARLPA